MIVSIGLGDEGVNVCLDDGCELYSPTRLVELCSAARKLFAGSYMDTLSSVMVDAEDDTEDDGAVEQ